MGAGRAPVNEGAKLYLGLLQESFRVLHGRAKSLFDRGTDVSRDIGIQPTREYIAQASGELAEMARDIGDRRLGHLLDLVATFAEMKPEVVRDGEPRLPR